MNKKSHNDQAIFVPAWCRHHSENIIEYLFQKSLAGYPYNVDVPSILHKYDFDDPEIVFDAKRAYEERERKKDDNIDYGKRPFIFYQGGWAGGDRGWVIREKCLRKGGSYKNIKKARVNHPKECLKKGGSYKILRRRGWVMQKN